MAQLVTIGDLPPEMICTIFRHLSLCDLVRFKLVCKLWNSLISSNFKVTRLFVSAYINQKERWHSSELVKEFELCHSNLFVSQSPSHLLSGLRHLKILDYAFDHRNRYAGFDSNQLNSFKELTHLEICSRHFINRPLNLKLVQLETLVLEGAFEGESRLVVDCPKLRKLVCDQTTDSLEVKHCDSIIYLDWEPTRLTSFKNVEVFKFRSDTLISPSTLQALPNLQIMCFDHPVGRLFANSNGSEPFKEVLRQFIDHAKRLKRVRFKFWFSGLLMLNLPNNDFVDTIDFCLNFEDGSDGFVSNEKLYMKNYGQLQEQLPFIIDVDYSVLMQFRLPENFFRKFWNIACVRTGKVVDEAHLLFFLNKLNLKELNFHNPGLNQSFYYQLPTSICLTNFYLVEGEEVQLNFDFLKKFNNLQFIDVLQSLSFASAKSLILSFHKLPRLESLEILFKSFVFQIFRTDSDQYQVSFEDPLRQDPIRINEVINYFEQFEVATPRS